MIKKPIKSNRPTGVHIIANHHIRANTVRVLDAFGTVIGVMDKAEAQKKAIDEDKDLILIAPHSQPPVTKIIEIAKYKYQLQQKKSEERKKSKVADIKEVRFSPFMGEKDFLARLNKVSNFLKKGDKVRLSLQFKGREITKKDFGFDIFNKVFNATTEIGIIELEPKLMGKKLISQIRPKK